MFHPHETCSYTLLLQLTKTCARFIAACLAFRSLEALESYMITGGGFLRSGDVFALAEVVRGLARCGRQSEVRLPPL